MSEFFTKYRNYIITFTILLSFVMHYRHLNKELMSVHVWRQTQTQSTINNFYEEDFNILNPRKNDRGSTEGFYRMEFPLMQWLVAGIYKILGKHLIITRVAMFILGVFSIIGLFKLLQAIFNHSAPAVAGAFAFTFSPCFFYYTINPLPDNMSLMASIWGLALFFMWRRSNKQVYLIISSIMLSVGTLCKLPFILYYLVPFTYFAFDFVETRKISAKKIYQIFVYLIPILMPALWYISVIPGWHGNGVTSGITDNKISLTSMLGILQHNLFSTLPELLLNYGSVLFFLAGFYFVFKNKLQKHNNFKLLFSLSIALTAYFLFEINMIGKVHDYYLFPFFPILFMLVGFGAFQMMQAKSKLVIGFTFVLFLSLPVLTELRMLSRWNPDNPGVNKDLFAYKDDLRKAVPNDALCVVGNDVSHFIMFYFVDKKGWCFHDGQPNLSLMISQGAEYLYLDTYKTPNIEYFLPYTESLIIERGSIRVYRLLKNH